MRHWLKTVISALLEQSGLESDTPFTFVRYRLERIHVHGRERTGCVRKFSEARTILITLNRLLTGFGMPLKQSWRGFRAINRGLRF